MPITLLPWAYQPLDATRRPQPEAPPKQQTDRPTGRGSDGFNFSTADEIRTLLGTDNVRRITPRNMARLSQTLFEAGHLSLREHAMLSFQPDIPTKTIPSQTLRDQPRDYVDGWEQQLEIQQQRGERPDFTRQTRRILNILNNLDSLQNPSRTDYTV